MNDYADIEAIAAQLTDDLGTNNGLKEGLRVFDTPDKPYNPPRRITSYDHESNDEIGFSPSFSPRKVAGIFSRAGTPAKSITILENGASSINRPAAKPAAKPATPPAPATTPSTETSANLVFGRKLEL
jgi:hypothetical protein